MIDTNDGTKWIRHRCEECGAPLSHEGQIVCDLCTSNWFEEEYGDSEFEDVDDEGDIKELFFE